MAIQSKKMTTFDTSWRALLDPGSATDFFSSPQAILTETIDKMVHLWWLAELSRFIYARGRTSLKNRELTLETYHLQETLCIEKNGICCTIVESCDRNHCSLAIVIFRGSNQIINWWTNIRFTLVPWQGDGRVHRGFRDAVCLIWDTLNGYLSSRKIPLIFTGHSLGGALAILAAAIFPREDIYVYAFGSPRIGDRNFSNSIQESRVLRIVNHQDIVSRMPYSLCFLPYEHCGILYYISLQGELWINPSEATVSRDQKQADSLTRSQFDPPEFLSDHAPINYVHQLEKLL